MSDTFIDRTFPTTVEYAGFWSRAVALLIDGFIANLLLFPFLNWMGVNADITRINESGFLSTVAWNLPFIVVAALFIYFKQATPGKMVLGLRVVDAETFSKPSMGQALGRQFAYIISAFVLCLGFIWVGFDRRKQGWHDKLAKTVVIKK